MLRNCVIAVIAWIAICGAYVYVLRGELPLQPAIVTSLAVGTAVWLGVVLVTGARFAYRDWRARKRMASGERPQDGDLVSISGEIRPVFEALQSPVSGRACVMYAYDIGADSHGETSVRDYAGFGMTRCSVYTPHGAFGLGTFPVLEHIAKTKGDPARAAEYVKATTFEPLDSVSAVASLVMHIYREAPPFRKDWRLGLASAEIEEVYDRIIAPGEIVTVTGRYASGRNELVSDFGEQGYLRLVKGRPAADTQSLPMKAIGQVIGGLVLIAAANAILWFLI